MSEATLHSVVVPVFNEVEGLEVFHERCRATLEGLGEPYELIYVDDGSHDGSWEVMSTIADREPNVRLVRLRATSATRSPSRRAWNVRPAPPSPSSTPNLQDPPEVIPELLARSAAGADVVYAVRVDAAARVASSWPRRPPSTV